MNTASVDTVSKWTRNHKLFIVLVTNVVVVLFMFHQLSPYINGRYQVSRECNGNTDPISAADDYRQTKLEAAILDVKEQLRQMWRNNTGTAIDDSLLDAIERIAGKANCTSTCENENPTTTGSHTHTTPASHSGINILIQASMRTGSSFAGELLRQNREIFYIFEPIQDTGLHDGDPTLPIKGVELLADLYKCNFSSPLVKRCLQGFNERPPATRPDKVKTWVTEQFCDRWDSKRGVFGTCKWITPEMATKSCESFRIKAAKIIRIHDLNILLHLMADDNMNLKVINLMRDPRSMMSSVMPIDLNHYSLIDKKTANKMLTVEHFTKSAGLEKRLERYCTSMLQNVLLGKQLSSWIGRDNYLPVRYEDLATDPFQVANAIYQFTGLGDLPPNVVKWLNVNTKADDSQYNQNYVYSTKRNSKAIVDSWRSKMTLDLVKKIQNTGNCATFMKIMKYRIVDSTALLLNMSQSLVLPLN